MTVTYTQNAEALSLELIRILEEEPHRIPEALAYSFLNKAHTNTPMDGWSWRNRFLQWLFYHDLEGPLVALTGKQWKALGRKPKAELFEKDYSGPAGYIWVPAQKSRYVKEDPDTGEEEVVWYVTRYKTIRTYHLSQTEGEDFELPEDDSQEFINNLPLIEVAAEWGIEVAVDHKPGALGWYQPFTQRIGMAVDQVQVWLHELVHAAHDRIGRLKKQSYAAAEVVAEFGSLVLAYMVGIEPNLGGTQRYVEVYARQEELTAVQAINKCLSDTIASLEEIFETAEGLGIEFVIPEDVREGVLV